MSRWSIDPPDDDRYDDKPLDAADIPADGDPWVTTNQFAFDIVTNIATVPREQAIDPAEHAATRVLEAFETLDVELAKCSTVNRALVLRTIVGHLYHQADRLALAATAKLDDLAG